MNKTFLFYLHLLYTSMRASITRRGVFLFETSLMVMNNLIFFAIWWIFFREFHDIDSWNIDDMAMLMAIGAGSYGLMQIVFGGIRNLSKIIINGDLDSFMTQPKNILLHVAGSKSHVKGWGHILTALVLIGFGGMTALQSLPLFIISMLCGCLVFTSAHIIVHSLPFWVGSVEGVAKKYCDSLYIFSLYPTNIYSGVLQLVMFTLIPAGVITYLPVELIRDFSGFKLFVLVASSCAFVVVAFFVFYRGLKRYESGNKFGMRL